MFVSKELIHVYDKAQEIPMPNLWKSEELRLPDAWSSKLLKSSMTPLHILHYTFLRVVQESLFMGTLMIDTSWKKSTQQWSSRSTNIMDFNITSCFYKVIWVSKNTFTVNSKNLMGKYLTSNMVVCVKFDNKLYKDLNYHLLAKTRHCSGCLNYTDWMSFHEKYFQFGKPSWKLLCFSIYCH